jgi:hypothetical protein
MAERIQRKRTKGYRLPEGAVYVGHGTKWGNRFRVVSARSTKDGPCDMWAVSWREQTLGRFDDLTAARADAVDRYRIAVSTVSSWMLAQARAELAGKDLACWCPLPEPGQPDHCHASILLALANEGDTHG